MKLLIVTTDKDTLTWKSLPKKMETIKDALQGRWDVSIQYQNVHPLIENGRVSHAWLKAFIAPYFQDGYDVVSIHMSKTQAVSWGLQTTLRGANPNSNGEYGDFYFWADENTLRLKKNQFIQTCLHEFCHEYFDKVKTTDITHSQHSKNADIVPFMKTLDWSLYQPLRQNLKTQIPILSKIAELYAKLVSTPTTLHPRLPDPYNKMISQDYGVENDRYLLTGRHIGIDYACPLGTPVYAPWDGDVIESGRTMTLGNYCYFRYLFDGSVRVERFLHLQSIPKTGKVSRGKTVAYSGNTGLSTGPHFHVDGFHSRISIDKITRTNWSELTYNPKV